MMIKKKNKNKIIISFNYWENVSKKTLILSVILEENQWLKSKLKTEKKF